MLEESIHVAWMIEIGMHQITCNPERNYLRNLCNTKYVAQVHFNMTELVLCLCSVLVKDVISKQGRALIFAMCFM